VSNCSGVPKTCQPLWAVSTAPASNSTRVFTPAVAGRYLYVASNVGFQAFGLPVPPDGAFHPHEPERLFDSRAEQRPFSPGETRSLKVTDRAGLPATGVSSVVVNVAVTEPTTFGYLTVYPSGTTRSLASSINFAPGQTISNAVVAKVGADGSIDVYNAAGTTHVVVDIEGWFSDATGPPGRRYQPVVPTRVSDTRYTTPLGPGETRAVSVAGLGGLPAVGRLAVVLDVAVTEPTAGGYLTLFRPGTSQPYASSINFAAGQTIANKVVVELGDLGTLDVYNATGDTHVVIDVEGWFGWDGDAPGAPYHPLTPLRIADTRFTAPVGPGGTLSLTVLGVGGVPEGATAVVLNLAVTQPSTDGYLTVYPSGAKRPYASSINFAPNQTVSNLVVATVGAGGVVNVYNATGSTHVVADVEGWFGP
jgi:hypothetical protein